MDISVVVPLYNEAESLPPLHEWISRVMTENGFSYEIIFVSDGSTDTSWDVIEQLRKDGRIHMLAEADYSEKSTARMWLCNKIEEFAERIREEERSKLAKYSATGEIKHLDF